MNKKFFSLPEQKRRAILNAGYRVFSQNSYKNSPMSEIAAQAGISKSLLFHYFRNKKELYLYLMGSAAEVTARQLERSGAYEPEDIFEMMRRGLLAKAELMRRHPDMAAFTLRAYYEKDPEVCREIQRLIGRYGSYRTNAPRLKLDPARFIPGLDLEMMYRDMFWASEGYLWEKTQTGGMDVDAMERDFARMIAFWKSVYLRGE